MTPAQRAQLERLKREEEAIRAAKEEQAMIRKKEGLISKLKQGYSSTEQKYNAWYGERQAKKAELKQVEAKAYESAKRRAIIKRAKYRASTPVTKRVAKGVNYWFGGAPPVQAAPQKVVNNYYGGQPPVQKKRSITDVDFRLPDWK